MVMPLLLLLLLLLLLWPARTYQGPPAVHPSCSQTAHDNPARQRQRGTSSAQLLD
jgi:hypothetical protein